VLSKKRILALASPVLVASSVGAGCATYEQVDADEQSLVTAAPFRDDTVVSGQYREPLERCRIPADPANPDRFAHLPLGSQIMIYRNDPVAGRRLRGLCTIDPVAGNHTATNYFSMLPAARDNRVEIAGDPVSSEISGVEVRNQTATTLEPIIARRMTTADTCGDHACEVRDVMSFSDNEVVEFLRLPPGAHVAYAAPHPTDRGTTALVDWLAAKPSSTRADAPPAIWAAGIDNVPKSAATSDRYHITATDLSSASFAGLAEIAALPVTDAVAFHCNVDGCPLSGSPRGHIDVLVGGHSGMSVLRQGIAETISWAIQSDTDSSYAVRYSGCTGLLGASDANFVNEITRPTNRGVQIELYEPLVRGVAGDPPDLYQGRQATVFGTKVADAVDQVYACITDRPDATNASYDYARPNASFVADAPLDTAYTQTGACNSWIAEGEVHNTSGGLPVRVFPSLDWAHATWDPVNGWTYPYYAGRGHLDLYQWMPASASGPAHWDRIAGGDFTTSADGTVTYGVRNDPAGLVYFPFVRAGGGTTAAGVVAVGSSGSTTLRAVIRMTDASGVPLPAGGIAIGSL